MNAFEQLVGEIYLHCGYWVAQNYKVDLTTEEKRQIGRHSSPRWEIDLIGYKAAANELHVIECKSFLDSTGVTASEFHDSDGPTKKRYKLFNEKTTREVILKRLIIQLSESGLVRPDPAAHMCLVAGKIKKGDEGTLKEYFHERGWILRDPEWIAMQITQLAQQSYTDAVAPMVAKLLLRK